MIKRYKMAPTICPDVCATADDGTEIFPATCGPKFCLSSDVEGVEKRNTELEAENKRLKDFILWANENGATQHDFDIAIDSFSNNQPLNHSE